MWTENVRRLVVKRVWKNWRGPMEPTDGTTRAILSQVRALGYSTRLRVSGEVAEIHAEGHGQRHVARAETLYRAAVELAGMIGIDLEDG